MEQLRASSTSSNASAPTAQSNSTEFDIFSLIATCKDAAVAAGEVIVTVFDKNDGKVEYIDKSQPPAAPDANKDASRNSNTSSSSRTSTSQKPSDLDAVAASPPASRLTRRRSSVLKDPLALYNLDPRTFADEQAHKTIVGSIHRHFPRCTLRSEEDGLVSDTTDSKQDELAASLMLSARTEKFLNNEGKNVLDTVNKNADWYKHFLSIKAEDVVIWVDPMDGTKAYLKGEKTAVTCLIGIASNVTGDCLAGVVHRPFTGHTVVGIVGMGLVTFGYGQKLDRVLLDIMQRNDLTGSDSVSLDKNETSSDENVHVVHARKSARGAGARGSDEVAEIIEDINANLKNISDFSDIKLKREQKDQQDAIETLDEKEVKETIRRLSNGSIDLGQNEFLKALLAQEHAQRNGNGLGFMSDFADIELNLRQRAILSKIRIIMTKIHFTAEMKEYLKGIVKRTEKKVDNIVRAGGAGNKVLLLLEGFADVFLFPNKGTKKWDTCAPQALIESIGKGMMTQPDGTKLKYFSNVEKDNLNGFVATLYGENYHNLFCLDRK